MKIKATNHEARKYVIISVPPLLNFC